MAKKRDPNLIMAAIGILILIATMIGPRVLVPLGIYVAGDICSIVAVIGLALIAVGVIQAMR